MVAETASSSFSLGAWLAAQDVSDRDETLSEHHARIFVLHQTLSDTGEGGSLLGRKLVDCADGLHLASVVSLVDDSEPRFALLVLIDILQIIRSRKNDEDIERRRRFCRIVAESASDIVGVLLEMGLKGDVCEDSMSYTLALFCFLLGEDSGIDGAGQERLRRDVSTPPWLKMTMRLWRDNSAVTHVPGSSEPDFERGLGFLVSAFLQHVSGCVEGCFVPGACPGRAALVALGPWFVSFLLVRLSAENVSWDERGRLVTVLWSCCVGHPTFATEFVWDDLAVVTAVAASLASISEKANVGLGHDDEQSVSPEEDTAKLDTVSVGESRVADDGPAGEQGPVENDDGERRISMLMATRAASSVFAHLRFFHCALLDEKAGGVRRRRFLRRYGLRVWFWDALRLCALFSYSLAGYEVALGAGSSKYIAAPCLRSSLSFIVWKAAEWLATDSAKWKKNPGGTVLSRPEIWDRLSSTASILCDATAIPLQAQCALNLAKVILRQDTGLESPSSSQILSGTLCEWCFIAGSDQSIHLKACGGCGRTWYCGSDHMRLHWKSGHKFACEGKNKGKVCTSSRLAAMILDLHDSTDWGNNSSGLAELGSGQKLLEQYGLQLARQGLALSVSPSGRSGKAVTFGQLLSQAKNVNLVTAMLLACRESASAFVPVVEGVASEEQKGHPRQMCLYRGDRFKDTLRSKCGRPGCCGHDDLCIGVL